MFWTEPPTPEIGMTPPATDDWWYVDGPGAVTQSGNRITESSAVRITAVWSCLRILTESIGQLPLHLYRRIGQDKERVTDHPAAQLLANPNDQQTRMEMIEHGTYHVESCGASYWEIVPGSGRRLNHGTLVPHMPGDVIAFYDGQQVNDMTRLRRGGRLVYRVRDGNGERNVPSEMMIHFRGGMMRQPLHSLSPVGELREALGAAQAASDYGARFFRNDAQPRGYLQWQGKIKDDEAADEIRRKWRQAYGGLNQQSVAVLAHGLDYKSIGLSNEDAQFLETRQYNARDVARIWRVPAHMINEMTGAIKANVEQMGLEFVTYTLMSRLSRMEQRLNHSLLGPMDREEYFFEFLVDGLMRADLRSRYFAYRQGTGGAAWITPNEVRRFENMEPHPDGDKLLQPLNMSLGPGPDGRGEEAEIEDEEREQRADALAQAELSEVSAELEKQRPGRFKNWSRVFYDRVAARVSLELGVSLDEARQYAEQSYAELLAADDAEGMRKVLSGWGETKAAALKKIL